MSNADNTAPESGTGLGAVDERLSPDGHWLFVVESKADAVATLAVDDGSLSESAGSPTSLPPGAAPAGIAVQLGRVGIAVDWVGWASWSTRSVCGCWALCSSAPAAALRMAPGHPG